MDDINNELELYERNARNAKSEFSTSFGSDNSLHHSISLYRREGRNKRFSMAPTVTTHLRPTAGTDMGLTISWFKNWSDFVKHFYGGGKGIC